MNALHERLRALPPERLRGIRRGIEKESLRALPGAGLALTPHPAALGSALTNPLITTDFSESQLELITGVPAPREDPRDPGAVPAADAEESTPSEYLLVAATRNGNERNAPHFGRFFAEALVSADADINKNDAISVQEAFDYADGEVAAYFEREGKLATEHAQLRGAGAAQFSLSRLNALDYETADPELSDLLQQRLDLDSEIESLQLRRNEFPSNAAYLSTLQALILESALLTEQIDAAQDEEGATGGTE